MEFTDQMAAKLLAHAIRQLGQAVNETLCVSPDRAVVRAILRDVRDTLAEFEEAYFDDPADRVGADTGGAALAAVVPPLPVPQEG